MTDQKNARPRLPWEITPEMFLSEKETADLLKHVRSAVTTADAAQQVTARTDALIIEVLLHSGLRTSEFCALRIADTMIGSGKSDLFVQAKRGESRVVHIPKRVSTLIRRYVETIRPKLRGDDSKCDETQQPLILNERGKPYERTGMYRRVKRILTEAGLGERASVQLLRHTYGYLAYKRTGGNLLFVQRQLGHAHPMVTSVYASLVDESYPKLAEVSGATSRMRRKAGRQRVAARTR